MIHGLRGPFADGYGLVEVYPGFNPKAVQHIDQLFRGQIARCARRVRAAAQPAAGTLKNGHAHFQGRVAVGQGHAAGVVKMRG